MSDPSPVEKPPKHSETDTINRRATILYEAYKAGRCDRDEYLDAIVRLVYQPLVSFVLHRTRYRAGYEEQKDVAHEVLKRFLQADFDLTKIRLVEYLFAAAQYLLIDRCRHRQRRREVPFDERSYSHGVSPHPAQTTEWLIGHAMRDAMKSLRWEYAFVFEMYTYEGYTQTELADMLGKRRSTIEFYLRRARRRLAETKQVKELISWRASLPEEG